MNADSKPERRLDIIVPLHNEEAAIRQFHQRLWNVVSRLSYQVTIYYVNDGSSDGTGSILQQLAASHPGLVVAELSRNFGQQAALTAGLDLSRGDVAITMDGDGQHPPELIPEMLQLYEAGFDLVLTQRASDRELSFFKRTATSSFYNLINRIGETRVIPRGADYRLTSRPIVEALRQMREYHRFLRGIISWMGYRSVILPYRAQERLGGKVKYSPRKMARLAMDAIFSFSLMPLQVAILAGLCFLVLASIEVLYVISLWWRGRQSQLVPGWSSLMIMLLLVGGILMILIGFVGIYVGYIFQQVKNRPIYLIRAVHPRPSDYDDTDLSCAHRNQS